MPKPLMALGVVYGAFQGMTVPPSFPMCDEGKVKLAGSRIVDAAAAPLVVGLEI